MRITEIGLLGDLVSLLLQLIANTVEIIPAFGPIIAAQVLSWLPHEILQSGSRRQGAAAASP